MVAHASILRKPYRIPLATILVFSALWQQVVGSTCYFPDGTVADGYTACGTTGACCYNLDKDHEDLCYDNGYCFSMFFGYIYRGGCTDKNWGSGSGCAKQCLDIDKNSGTLLTSCVDPPGYNYMCCGTPARGSNCCSDSATFDWNNASFIGWQRARDTNTATSTTSGVSTATGTTSSSSTASCVAQDANANPSVSGQQTCSNNDNTAIYAGLGVPLGLFVITTIFFGWKYAGMRERVKHVQSTSYGIPAMTPNHPRTPPPVFTENNQAMAQAYSPASSSAGYHHKPAAELQTSARRSVQELGNDYT